MFQLFHWSTIGWKHDSVLMISKLEILELEEPSDPLKVMFIYVH